MRVGTGGELASLLHPVPNLGRLVGNLVVVPGRRRVAGQVGDVEHVIAAGADVVVEDRRDEHHAVQLHAIVAEHVGQRRGAGCPVGFTDEELGRVPALVHIEIALNEAVEGAQVLVHAGEILGGSFAHGARVAGKRRVDEDQVALVEQRILVGNQLEGRSGGGIGAVGLNAHRRKRSHVQPQRGRAGAAVVEEANGARLGLGAIQGVGHVEDAAVGLILFIADEQGAGGRGVLECLAAEGDLVMGGDGLLGGNGRRGVLVVLVVSIFMFGRVSVLLGGGLSGRSARLLCWSGGAEEQRGQGNEHAQGKPVSSFHEERTSERVGLSLRFTALGFGCIDPGAYSHIECEACLSMTVKAGHWTHCV